MVTLWHITQIHTSFFIFLKVGPKALFVCVTKVTAFTELLQTGMQLFSCVIQQQTFTSLFSTVWGPMLSSVKRNKIILLFCEVPPHTSLHEAATESAAASLQHWQFPLSQICIRMFVFRQCQLVVSGVALCGLFKRVRRVCPSMHFWVADHSRQYLVWFMVVVRWAKIKL